MKFLAILKDSFRETLDTWVFYVMVGLSVLVTGLAFTLKFEAAPASKEFMDEAAKSLATETGDPGLDRLQEQLPFLLPRQYDIVQVEPLDGAADDPSSSFRVFLHAHFLNPRKVVEVKANPQETLRSLQERFGRAGPLHFLQVRDVRLVDPAKLPTPPTQTPGKEDFYFELITDPTATTVRYWPHKCSVLFGALDIPGKPQPLCVLMVGIENLLITSVGAWIALLVSVVITAFFIPNMVRKGTVDLLIVKPIHRITLLLYKYVGGLTFIFLNTTVAVVGVWLALSLRSGVWAYGFLFSIVAITCFFAILYSLSTLVGVVTRSVIASILVTCPFWLFLCLVGWLYYFMVDIPQQAAQIQRNVYAELPPEVREKQKLETVQVPDNWFTRTLTVLHFVLPRAKDLDILTDQMIARDLVAPDSGTKSKLQPTSTINWTESLTISAAFIVVMLGLSCWWFATRDF